MLDAAELFQLAIHATQKGDHHAALSYLKQVLELEPTHATARYLLAAEHAELGLFDRAIEGMEAALKLDGGIEMARFQLALLYLRHDRSADAKAQLSQLFTSADAGLRLSAQALHHLADNEPQQAHDLLGEAIPLLSHNLAMQGDMTRLREQVATQMQTPPSTDSVTTPAAEPEKSASNTVYLGEYRKAHQPDPS